jgi:hypothetical protein
MLAEASCGGLTPQARLGADASFTRRLRQRSPGPPLKKTTIIYRVSTEVLNKSNHTRGGEIIEIMHGFIKGEVRVYLQSSEVFHMQGFI